MKLRAFISVLLLLYPAGVVAEGEHTDRQVDAVALIAQQEAVSKLAAMAKKYKNTEKEAVFLARLAEYEQQAGAIIFRVAHGIQSQTGGAIDLGAYRKQMLASVKTLDRLISRYPRFEEIHLALFLRGKAYEEIENKKAAEENYLRLVKDFPEAIEVYPAYMSLAQFAIDSNLHEKAIGFLKKVEANKEGQYYPFALYKLAWSHYNLKRVEEALGYAKTHVRFYRGSQHPSDQAFRENMLSDVPLFVFEGFEQGKPEFLSKEVLSLFRDLEPKDSIGKMLSKYAKLLRSHSHNEEMLNWKNLVMKEEGTRPEILDVLVVAYEHHQNHNRFSEMLAIAEDMVRHYARHPLYEGFKTARTILLDTAERLQKLVLKNKGIDGVKTLTQSLASTYDAFTRITKEDDPRVPRVHYNLAETLFAIDDFEDAVFHYRWVVARPSAVKLKGNEALRDAGVKSVAARYSSLKKAEKLATTLAATALSASRKASLSAQEKEWITWIDELYSDEPSNKDLQKFSFEASRLLYSRKDIQNAFDRLDRFARKHRGTDLAQASAALVIDTCIASADWATTFKQASSYLSLNGWNHTAFEKKLAEVASDAQYKIAEADFSSKKPQDALERIEDLLTRSTKDSYRRDDFLSLAASSAVSSKHWGRAVTHFSSLIADHPKSPHSSGAVQSRAIIHEQMFDPRSAASDYLAYFELWHKDPKTVASSSEKEMKKIAAKALALARVSGDLEQIERSLKSPACAAAEDECRRQRLAVATIRGGTPEEFEEMAEKSEKDLAAAWTLLALRAEQKEGAKALSFHRRLKWIRAVASTWDKMEGPDQLASLPLLNEILPRAVRRATTDIKSFSPLRSTERAITHRVETVRIFEATLMKVVKLPFSRMKAVALNELAEAYMSFASELRKLSAPKDMPAEEVAAYEETIAKITLPFEEKGNEIRGKAFDIASQAAIDFDDLNRISTRFFEENPSLAKNLKDKRGENRVEWAQAFQPEWIARLDPDREWRRAFRSKGGDLTSKQEDIDRLIGAWARAASQKNVPLMSYLAERIADLQAVPKSALSLIRAMALLAGGARAEGLNLIEGASTQLASSGRKEALNLLASLYRGSFAETKAMQVEKNLRALQGRETAATPSVH